MSSQQNDQSSSKKLEIYNQKIENMIGTLLHVFRQINYDTSSIIISADKQQDITDKLSILIRKAAVILFESEANKVQNTRINKKQAISIPRSPKKSIETNNEFQNDEILRKSLESIKDIFQIYNILAKVYQQNNKSVVYKCFDQFQNTFKCIQNQLSYYHTLNSSVSKVINQITKSKFISHSLYHNDAGSNTPSISKFTPNNIQSSGSGNLNQYTPGEKRTAETHNQNGMLSEKSTLMIEDLKEQISLLNHALNNNDRNYQFQIQKYQNKLLDLGQTVKQLKQILWQNQKVYQNQTQALHTQIYEYKLLVRNMARKIRNLQTSNSFGQSSYQIQKNREFLRDRPNRFRGQRVQTQDYMCSRLSRQRQRMHERDRSIKRLTGISGYRRSISRQNKGILRSSNSRNKLI